MISLASVLFVLTMAAVAGIAFFGTDLKARLEQIGLARRPDFSAAYRKLNVPPLPAAVEANGTV